ncbi:hypothetical protein Rhe02_01890 [Rhizocola hellebori]|uniref:Carboxypeptidase regulatory-like domain-containing protein n=1 Tax=Rhizocola hellebori TaxID=1392758 RepID=A0A8J3Q2C1_9ACTN|nr:carboxypeptidase regulatory-like domain-containing protein [Rhizocola hellebori]GIH02122.1 hypothetical protein Rhe02_01890 [Rhizocola hellebori]
MPLPDEHTGPLVSANAALLHQLAAAGVAVEMSPPPESQDRLRLMVWPVALLPEDVPAQAGNPLRLRVRYVVAVGGPAEAALALWDRLLETEQPYLVPEKVSSSLWQAIGVGQRLGLLFEVPVQFARPVTTAPRVTSLPSLVSISLRRVHGRVVTSGGVPLAGMRVAAADGTSVTHSDTNGHFVLSGVQADQPLRLNVTGRGLRLAAEVAAVSAEPVVITCEI